MKTMLHNAADPGPIQRPDTLKDLAYRKIKNQLVAGYLQQDKIYSAQHFAEQFGISRTPAREALLQLTSEGFLICLGVRGFKIKEFSEKEIRDVFETRQVIEAYVVDRAAGELSSEDVKKLKDSLKAMAGNAERQDVAGFMEADKEFHLALVRRINNQHLGSIMEDVRDYLSIFGLKALSYEGRAQDVLREHKSILDALCQGNRKMAVESMRHHLTKTEQCLLGTQSDA